MFGLSLLAAELALGVMLVVRPLARRVPVIAFDRVVLAVITASTALTLIDAFS